MAQQTTTPPPNTLFGQRVGSMSEADPNDFALSGMPILGLDALEDLHFAGSAFGVYDQYGPWVTNSIGNFGVFDPVMNARIGGNMDHFLGPQSQSHSPMDDNFQKDSGSGPMGRGSISMGSYQQTRQHHLSPLANVSMRDGNGQVANQHMGNQMGSLINHSPHPQMASMGGMSTGVSIPPVTASDTHIGRPFTYNATQQHQQLPSMPQMGVGNIRAGSMPQGGGYPSSPMAWDGLLPLMNQQYQQGQHQNLPPFHGQGMNVPHHQSMSGADNQGMNAQHNPGMNDLRQHYGQPGQQHGHSGRMNDPRHGHR